VKRVLWVVHSPSFGGPHNEALRLAGPLRERGFETVVAVPNEPGTAAPHLREAGIEVEQLPLGRLRASRDPRQLLRFGRDFRSSVGALEAAIDRAGADIVQIGGLVNPHAAFAARRRGAAVVWQILDAYAPAPVRRLALPLVHRYAEAVMFSGEAMLAAHGGRDSFRAPVFVYYPPVDTERFAPGREGGARVRQELDIPADAPLVGTVSVLVPVKTLECFLAAAERIAASLPEARFVIVGSAPESHAAYGESLRRRAEALNLPHPVVFAGDRTDVEDWYPAFDLHVLTSRSEGAATTVLEAQACGVPVVAADVGALHEVVTAGETGVLLPPGDPEAIAEAVLGLLRDPERRAELGRAARVAALERFGLERAADLRVRVYEAALAGAASRGSTSG
jgi:glycosyltransferase involved in cell wall biosynthesis